MENRLRDLFLILFSLYGLTTSGLLTAQTVDEAEDETENSLVQPQIERTNFDESLIDTEDFELSIYAGLLSIEDFGANSMVGLKLAYHVSEDLMLQAATGNSEAGRTSFELLSGGAPLLSKAERQLEFYQLNLGYNILPGEAFISEGTAINTIFYIIGGIGITEFAGDDRFTINYGFGYRMLFADAISLSLDFRDHVFNMDLFGEEKVTHNLEGSIALSWFF